MVLDVKAGGIILRVKEVLRSDVLLLEAMDGKECREYSKNYAPCHLPIKCTIHLEMVVMPEGLPCLGVGRQNNGYYALV